MAGIPCCSVQITIGGKTESANFRLGPSSVDVNYVEGRMRADYGVVDGILSYDNNVIRSVEELEADNVYYFVRFRFPQGTQVPQQADVSSMRNRGDLLRVLRAKAIEPVQAIVDKMVEYFSAQLPFVTPDGLVKLYRRADKIPNTFTKAQVKSAFNGLVLDDVFPAIGGRAVLLRAFRGCQPLLVKIPLNQTEAAAELDAFSQLGAYDPSATCILGPIAKLELQRDHGRGTDLAIEMPICTCSVATVPRPAVMGMVDATARTLVTALNFLHSKNRVHGDVKLSNILIRETGDQFLADLGSSVEIGAELATMTLNCLPRGTNAEDLKATVELDWFQAGLSLVHLLGLKSAEDQLEKEEVKELLRTIVNPSSNIQVIMEKLE